MQTKRKYFAMRVLRWLILPLIAATVIILGVTAAEAATSRIDSKSQKPFVFRWDGSQMNLYFNRNGHNDLLVENAVSEQIHRRISDGAFVRRTVGINVYYYVGSNDFSVSTGSFWISGFHYDTHVTYIKGNWYPIELMNTDRTEVYAVYNAPFRNKAELNTYKDNIIVHSEGAITGASTISTRSGSGTTFNYFGRRTELRKDGIYVRDDNDKNWYKIYNAAKEGYTVTDIGHKADGGKQEKAQWHGNTNTYAYWLGASVPIASTENDYFYDNQVWYKYQINQYQFDINIDHGTADVYVGGKRVADDVRDWYRKYDYKSVIEVKDIKVDPGYHNAGASSYKQIMGTKGWTCNVDIRPNTYTVKYDGNDASDGFMNDQTATYDTKFVTRQNAFSKTGYDFNGWNEKADGSGTAWGLNSYGVYENGNGTKPWQWKYTHDITLYAQWKYNVIFDPNLDSVSTVGNVVQTGMPSAASPLACYYQEGQKLPSNTYSVYGYTFAGWSTNKADVDAQYADGATILSNPTPNNGNTVTLYAIWKIDSYPITYKLQKDSDAETDMPGTVSLANKKTVVYPAHGGLYFENPRLTNEKFTGWTCTELGITDKTKNLTISSDQVKTWYEAKTDKHDNVGITLVAHFEAIPPFEFVDSKTGQTPILNETEKNQGKFRVEEVESSPGYIYEDQYHDIDIHDNDDTHEYQDSDYRNLTFPEKNGK